MTLRELFTAHSLTPYIDAFEGEHVAIGDLPGMLDEELAETFGLRGYGDRKRFRAMVASLGAGAGASPSTTDPGATRAGPLPLDPGVTRAGPPPADPGATRGLTILGKSVSVESVDLSALPTGTAFDGRYTIVDLLGRGGMGAVYQAVDKRVKQTVALKTLPSSQPALLDALAREVALAQELNHANLLGVRHLETRGDAPYLIMELMDGGDLSDALAASGGKLDPGEARRVLDGVLSGLSALHGARVAHLDVKPANVLLGRDGRVKLADFGISSRMREQRAGGSGAGTPDYAPPEQLRGEPCDARADVYAAGLLAHVLLAGRLPYDGRTLETIRRWHDVGERVFPLVSPAVAAVLAKAVAVRRDDRYRTAEELRIALMAALRQKRWYALADGVADGLRGKVAAEVRVVESDARLRDAAELLAAGAALPGWETQAGLVVLWAEPLAAVFAGRELAGEDAARQAGAEALAGRFDALAKLGEQGASVEAGLALAAHLGGDANLALRRRAMAESSAKSVAERLSVAIAVRGGVGRAEDAREALSRAERAARSTEEHAHVASVAQALFGDGATAIRALLAAERAAKSAADHLVVAQAQLSVAGDARACGLALERYAEAAKHAPDALVDAARTLGEQPALRAWAERLEREAGDDVERLEAVREGWAALGDAASAARSAEARAGSLEKQLEELLARLAAVGLKGKLPEGLPTLAMITKLTGTVEHQERLHREALSLDGRLAKIEVPAEAWAKPYTEQAVEALRKGVKAQEGMHAQALALDSNANTLGVPLETWARPYRALDVDVRAQLVKREQARAQEAAALDARRAELGLGATAWVFPITEAAIAMARAELVAWEGWAREVEETRDAAQGEFGWAPDAGARPHDADSVARVRAEVKQQRRWHARVAAVSWVGLARPPFPLGERSVRAYELAVAAARRRARNTLLVVIGVVFVGLAGPRVMAMRAELQAQSEEAERLSQKWDSPTFGTMQWVPAGSFIMGSPSTEFGRGDEEAQHSVTLTQGLWMMEHEVTQGEWQAMMGNTPARFTSCGPTCPVETVSWDEAVEFATRASARDGVTYRLPTEAEWEYAARGRQSHLYAGSDDVGAVGWYGDNSGNTTHPVCQKQRNAYDLCDMTGNVWEWTSDRFGDYPSAKVADPAGASSGSDRFARGGSWFGYGDSALSARVASRLELAPATRFDNLGFRLVRTAP